MTEEQGWLLLAGVLLLNLHGLAHSVGVLLYGAAVVICLRRRGRETA